MRLSLKKGAHAVLSRAVYRKFGVSAWFWQMWDSEDLDPDRAGCHVSGAVPRELLLVEINS
jgi:hypothetical protein